MVCGQDQGAMVESVTQVNNGTVIVSMPIYRCHRCSRCKLDPLQHVRYRLSSNNLTLDLGNPEVAEKYASLLREDLDELRHVFADKDASTPVESYVGGTRMNIPLGFYRDAALRCGVQSVEKVAPSDPGFES
jgi:hypothetical protein